MTGGAPGDGGVGGSGSGTGARGERRGEIEAAAATTAATAAPLPTPSPLLSQPLPPPAPSAAATTTTLLYSAVHSDASVLACRAPALGDWLLRAPAAEQLAYLHAMHVEIDGLLRRIRATKVSMTGTETLCRFFRDFCGFPMPISWLYGCG